MTGAACTLVVGGAGFIGSHVVDELVEAGRRVRVLDSLHPLAHSGAPPYLNPEAEYVWGDVRDPAAVAAALAGVDAISHQAAMVGLGLHAGEMPDYVDHNCSGTAILLSAMYEQGFEGPLVLASSMVVYGEGRYRCPRHGPIAPLPRAAGSLSAGEFEPVCPRCSSKLDPEPVSESALTDPRSVYAATKLHQEHLCLVHARESQTPLIALRYHNVYGPRMPRDTPYAGVASIFRSALEGGRAPRVFEDGRQIRDFVHVGDVARANRLALDADPSLGGAFNIASGVARPIGELARTLAAAMGGPEPEVTGEFRLGDVRHVFASIERAQAELAYRPAVGFEQGVAEFATAPLRASAAGVHS